MGPNYYDKSDPRQGWDTKHEAELAKVKLSSMYNRAYNGPEEVPDDYILYNGCKLKAEV